ncbi:hypothetical protein KY284_033432 [Solanum tuberosum]|nr:hypothetical protein KY284_033432 [Solanum tuberosum]
MGLNEAYSGVMSSILMMDPLPSVGQAYSLLIQVEKHCEVHVVSHPTDVAFMANYQKFQRRFTPHNSPNVDGRINPNFDKPKTWKFCTHCKLTNMRLLISKRNPSFGTTTAQVRISQSHIGMSTGQYFSPEQSSHLFQLMQDAMPSQQNEKQSDVNVLANCAGASEHMTYESSLHFNLTSLPSSIYVCLPNSHRLKGPSMKRPVVLGKVHGELYLLNTTPLQSSHVHVSTTSTQDDHLMITAEQLGPIFLKPKAMISPL